MQTGAPAGRARERTVSARRTFAVCGLVSLAYAAAACVLLTEQPRRTVAWGVVETTPREVGCMVVSAHVVRTGKQGIGVVVSLRGRDESDCHVHHARVSLRLENGLEVLARNALPEVHVTSRETVEAYVPLYFDDDDAWNHGVRRAKLHVVMGDERASLALYHRVEGGEP